MLTVSIEFTQDEGNRILSLLDHAVRRKGLYVAKDSVYFQDKIGNAFVRERLKEEAAKIASKLNESEKLKNRE